MPSIRSACSRRESLASEPETSTPRAASTRAMPDMPAPPIPTMCTRPREFITDSGMSPPLRCVTFLFTSNSHDPLRHGDVGVPFAMRGRCLGHVGKTLFIMDYFHDGVGEPLRGKVLICLLERATGGDDRARVTRLLAITDGQRHENGREPDGRNLRTRHRAGPAHHDVRHRVSRFHAIDVGHWDVAGPSGRQFVPSTDAVQYADS